ncbi:hypothetical protein [Aquimarina rhabdastrellae]
MFIFLIAIAILGVLFRSIIEFPNEIFFGNELLMKPILILMEQQEEQLLSFLELKEKQ